MTDTTTGARRTAFITGASSGIGEALAHCFAEAGQHLVLVARRGDKLRALADELEHRYGIVAMVQVADLAEPGAAARLAATLKRRRCAVNVLVNNAGVLTQGSFVGMKPERHRQMIDLNIAGLTAMLSAFVPPSLANGIAIDVRGTMMTTGDRLVADTIAIVAATVPAAEAARVELEGIITAFTGVASFRVNGQAADARKAQQQARAALENEL